MSEPDDRPVYRIPGLFPELHEAHKTNLVRPMIEELANEHAVPTDDAIRLVVAAFSAGHAFAASELLAQLDEAGLNINVPLLPADEPPDAA